jgi:hypothetical protein
VPFDALCLRIPKRSAFSVPRRAATS